MVLRRGEGFRYGLSTDHYRGMSVLATYHESSDGGDVLTKRIGSGSHTRGAYVSSTFCVDMLSLQSHRSA